MKIALSIPLNELKAAALFASTDITRFILNSVCLQVRPAGHLINIVATDGRRIALIKSEAESLGGDRPDQVTNVLIPLKLLSRVRPLQPAKRGPKIAKLTIESIGDQDLTSKKMPPRFLLTFDDGDTQMVGKSIEGHYPNFFQVFPSKPVRPASVPVSVNGRFVTSLYEASVLLSKAHPAAVLLAPLGKGQCIIARLNGIENFASVIMPVRVDDCDDRPDVFDTPTWLDKPVFTPAEEPKAETAAVSAS